MPPVGEEMHLLIRRICIGCALVLVCAGGLLAAAEPSSSAVAPLAVEEIVARMTTRNMQRAASLSGYRSTRTYELDYSGFPSGKHAKMVVAVSLEAPGKKTFSIVSEEGSGLLLKRVLHRLLESEQEAADGANREDSALTEKNYEFELLRNDALEGRPCYVLGVKAKRDSKFLYDGQIWVDAEDFAVARIEARPSKNPSFWISQTSVEHRYMKRGEFWLPMQNRSSSKVRMGGRAVLTIDYGSYETVSGRQGGASPVERTLNPMGPAAESRPE